MWSRTITRACLSALTLCACASLHAESQLFDDIAEQSLLVPQRVAALPAEIAPSHETSQQLGILSVEQIQPESHSTADNTDDGSYDNCCRLIPTSKMCPCTYGWAEGLLLWRDNDATNRPVGDQPQHPRNADLDRRPRISMPAGVSGPDLAFATLRWLGLGI